MRISFGFKVGLGVNIALLIGVGFSGFFFYNNTKGAIISLVANRIKDLAKASTFYFTPEDRKYIENLRERFLSDPSMPKIKGNPKYESLEEGAYKTTLSDKKANAYMNEKGFQTIVQHLRQIKEASRDQLLKLHHLKQIDPNEDIEHYPLVEYTYLLIKLSDISSDSLMMFLADADYQPIGEEEGNPIGNVYIPEKGTALTNAFKNQVSADKEFIEDEWGIWLSGAAPILNNQGEVIAILGLDYSVSSEANEIRTLFWAVFTIIAISLLFGIFISYIVSRILSKPIEVLTLGAERVANRDYDTRISIKSKDELGVLANSFNTMVQKIKSYITEMEQLNQSYFRFVPKSFLENLGLSKITEIQLGDQVQKEMTVIFSDIRSFTSLAEKMEPKEVFEFINSYLEIVGPIIRKYNGFIDKYIGDAIMALFPQKPIDALHVAIAMRKAMYKFNKERIAKGQREIDVGIGINTGNLILGTIGEIERMETTVFADAVNIASRLEGYTKKFKAPIIVGKNTVKSLSPSEREKFSMRYLGNLRVRGKQEATDIYQLLLEDDEGHELKLKTKIDFENGVKSLIHRRYEEAKENFEKVIQVDPKDSVASVYVEQISKFTLST